MEKITFLSRVSERQWKQVLQQVEQCHDHKKSLFLSLRVFFFDLCPRVFSISSRDMPPMCLWVPPLLTTWVMSASDLAGGGHVTWASITQDAAVPRSWTPQLPAAALPWNALCLHFPNTLSMAQLSGKEQGYRLPHQQRYLTTLALLDFVRPRNGKRGPR